MYADETSIFFSSHNYTELLRMGNELLDKLSIWSNKNCLQVNCNKTKSVICRSPGE